MNADEVWGFVNSWECLNQCITCDGGAKNAEISDRPVCPFLATPLSIHSYLVAKFLLISKQINSLIHANQLCADISWRPLRRKYFYSSPSGWARKDEQESSRLSSEWRWTMGSRLAGNDAQFGRRQKNSSFHCIRHWGPILLENFVESCRDLNNQLDLVHRSECTVAKRKTKERGGWGCALYRVEHMMCALLSEGCANVPIRGQDPCYVVAWNYSYLPALLFDGFFFFFSFFFFTGG